VDGLENEWQNGTLYNYSYAKYLFSNYLFYAFFFDANIDTIPFIINFFLQELLPACHSTGKPHNYSTQGGPHMLTRWSDFDRMFEAMGLLKGRLDSMYDDFGRSYGYTAGLPIGGNVPRTNLYDKGDVFELIAELPGLAKEQLNLRIQGNYLELSGNLEISAPEGYTPHRNERGSASFTRSLTLPADINSSEVTATLKNGILTITLPKAEAAKPCQITIK